LPARIAALGETCRVFNTVAFCLLPFALAFLPEFSPFLPVAFLPAPFSGTRC
jgi:hypothetical protein